MAKTINPLKALQAFVDKHESQRSAAAALGVSAPFLTMVLTGKRQISPKILKKLGLYRGTVVTYRHTW
jgi:plasmid maintenance system antidote protein VapI